MDSYIALDSLDYIDSILDGTRDEIYEILLKYQNGDVSTIPNSLFNSAMNEVIDHLYNEYHSLFDEFDL
mgnify:CR=1 FL=1